MAEEQKQKAKVGTVEQTSPGEVKERLERIKVRRVQRKSDARGNKRGRDKDRDELDTRIINIRRVTRVYKGGKRMRLSAFVVVGDRKGSIGLGVGKGSDVRSAEAKAINYARKHMVKISLKGNTLPHQIIGKSGAAEVFMKPAAPGTGVIAGSAARAVVEVAGVKDILTKVLGSDNSINNAYATLDGLTKLRLTRS
ncbi:30S ribosomal protein S5 [Candidatus Dojkabacteria bacterium]|nr:30S ribosomal protein S5 [Candidatus Dojkabacteria bacterium]